MHHHLPANALAQFLILHGYWFAVPIMIVEGPVVTVAMGFFASFGYFNPFVVFLLGFFSDLISDTAFYLLGFLNGQKVINRFGRLLRFNDRTAESVKQFYDRHGGKSVFIAKILTGIVPPVFIVAGYSRMNLKKFYSFAAAGGVIWSGGLVALGYFFGSQFEGHFSNIGRIFGITGIVLLGVLILFFVYRFYLHKLIERRLKIFFNGPSNHADKEI